MSNSLYFSNGVGDGVAPTGGLAMPANGVTANADAAMSALRSELDAFENFVTGLAPESTLIGGGALPDFSGIEDEDIFTLDIDALDTNNDGLAVIDIRIDNGNSDFKITNSNWIIDGDGSTLALFRILGNSNLVLSQSTIVLGDGGIANLGLGALFVKANDYNNGMGGVNAGEALDSGDTVFNFNNTVLNGVGVYDLIAFDEQNDDLQFDNGKTEIVVNDGQGCAQFVAAKINFNDVRFEHCMFPQMPALASLGDLVWYDTDMDGVRDPGELGIEGITVYLLDDMGVMIDSMLTDMDGMYLFADLTPGTYEVRFDLLPDHVFSPRNAAMDDATDSDADLVTGRTGLISLAAGQNDLTWDAGMFRELQTVVPEPTTAAVLLSMLLTLGTRRHRERF